MTIATLSLIVLGCAAAFLLYKQHLQNRFYLGGDSDIEEETPKETFVNLNNHIFQRPNIFEDQIYDKFIQSKINQQLKDTLINKNPKADILSGKIQIPSLFVED